MNVIHTDLMDGVCPGVHPGKCSKWHMDNKRNEGTIVINGDKEKVQRCGTKEDKQCPAEGLA